MHLETIMNKKGIFLRRKVERLSWKEYFESVIGSYDLDSDNSSPLPVIQALQPSSVAAGP